MSGVTFSALGTAMDLVITANSIFYRTTAPASTGKLTACAFIGTLMCIITFDNICPFLLSKLHRFDKMTIILQSLTWISANFFDIILSLTFAHVEIRWFQMNIHEVKHTKSNNIIKTYGPSADKWLIVTNVAVRATVAFVFAAYRFWYWTAVPIIMATCLISFTLHQKCIDMWPQSASPLISFCYKEQNPDS